MRLSMIAGLGLLLAGLFVLVRGGSFTTHREVIKIGDVSVSAEEKRPIDAWLAGAAVIGGIVLLGGGARRKA